MSQLVIADRWPPATPPGVTTPAAASASPIFDRVVEEIVREGTRRLVPPVERPRPARPAYGLD